MKTLIQVPGFASIEATRKHLAGEHADLASLRDDRFAGGVRLRCQFGLVNLKIETLEALAIRNELGFADSHSHRSASS